MTPLKDIPGAIDIVLLDGWKDMCLPVLRSLESRLAPGALMGPAGEQNPATQIISVLRRRCTKHFWRPCTLGRGSH
jgi:hypothetical protein